MERRRIFYSYLKPRTGKMFIYVFSGDRFQGCKVFCTQLNFHYDAFTTESAACYSIPGWGGGVHDLRMDGGLPPGFQKATLL